MEGARDRRVNHRPDTRAHPQLDGPTRLARYHAIGPEHHGWPGSSAAGANGCSRGRIAAGSARCTDLRGAVCQVNGMETGDRATTGVARRLPRLLCAGKPAHPREHPPSLFSRPDRGSICCLMTFGDADLRGLDWNAGELMVPWRTCLALLYNCEIVCIGGLQSTDVQANHRLAVYTIAPS
jgi:hypothetical protein